MNAWRWLMAPWMAAHRAMRWLMIAIAALSMTAAVALIVFRGGPAGVTAAVYLLIPMVGLAWVFFLPNMLLLAVMARNLCLPGVRRDVVASLCLYAVLSTVVPALVLACAGAHPVVAMLILALAAGIGVLFATLPWILGVVMCWAPMAMQALPASVVSLPDPDTAAFVPRAGIIAAALVVIVVCRLWQLLRPGGMRTRGLRRPLILGLNQTLTSTWSRQGHVDAYTLAGQHSELHLLRRRPAWMQPRADVRHTGPGKDRCVHTLRVALGSGYLPRTLRDHARTLLPGLLSLLLMVPVLAWLSLDARMTLHALWWWGGLLIAGCIGFCANLWLPLATMSVLQQRFGRANGELPLLALLPGLGSAASVKRDLLRTCLLVPLRAQAVATVLLVLVALALHLHGKALLLVLVAQLGSMLWLGATVLYSLSGQVLSLWVRVSVAVCTWMLFSLSCWLPLTTLGATPWPMAHVIVTALPVAWLLLGEVLLRISLRGWRALQQRPHAFLPIEATDR